MEPAEFPHDPLVALALIEYRVRELEINQEDMREDIGDIRREGRANLFATVLSLVGIIGVLLEVALKK
jgi:hypothetical protein